MGWRDQAGISCAEGTDAKRGTAIGEELGGLVREVQGASGGCSPSRLPDRRTSLLDLGIDAPASGVVVVPPTQSFRNRPRNRPSGGPAGHLSLSQTNDNM